MSFRSGQPTASRLAGRLFEVVKSVGHIKDRNSHGFGLTQVIDRARHRRSRLFPDPRTPDLLHEALSRNDRARSVARIVEYGLIDIDDDRRRQVTAVITLLEHRIPIGIAKRRSEVLGGHRIDLLGRDHVLGARLYPERAVQALVVMESRATARNPQRGQRHQSPCPTPTTQTRHRPHEISHRPPPTSTLSANYRRIASPHTRTPDPFESMPTHATSTCRPLPAIESPAAGRPRHHMRPKRGEPELFNRGVVGAWPYPAPLERRASSKQR